MIAPAAHATSPISAYKTAEAHWTRTFEWTIEKSVSPDSWNLEAGQSGTSTYTVKVTKSPALDTIWVDVQVCVENVSTTPTENLKVVDRLQALVGDAVIALASVPLDMSLNPVLDPGESQCYPYSIPFEPVAGAAYRNNARVTVTNDPRNPGEEMGPNEKVDFTLPDPTVVNGSVNVDDTNGLSWLFADSGTQTYTRTFSCGEDEGTHDNTATIRETGQSDDARVTVTCKPPPGPGCTLTQGYWKTHSKYGPAPYDSTWALIGEDTGVLLQREDVVPGHQHVVRGRERVLHPRPPVHRREAQSRRRNERDSGRQCGAGRCGGLLRRLHAVFDALEVRPGAGDRLRRHPRRLQRG